MRELESTEKLKALFPDLLWANPQKQAPKWSEDDGIIVKRKGNPKESTVEAWGLVDGQPTSKHYGTRIYNDVVTRESVYTPARGTAPGGADLCRPTIWCSLSWAFLHPHLLPQSTETPLPLRETHLPPSNVHGDMERVSGPPHACA